MSIGSLDLRRELDASHLCTIRLDHTATVSALYPTSWDPSNEARCLAHRRWMERSCGKPTAKPAGSSTSRLLELPAELRLLIWESALTEDQAIRLPYALPALLRTSRLMAADPAEYHYKCNTFILIVEDRKRDEHEHFLALAGQDSRRIRPGRMQLELCGPNDLSTGPTTDAQREAVHKMLRCANQMLTAFKKGDWALSRHEARMSVSEGNGITKERADEESEALTQLFGEGMKPFAERDG